jgi:hypothetical protein
MTIERSTSLAGLYQERAEIWRDHYCCLVDCYNVGTHVDDYSDLFDKEQKFGPTKPYSGRTVTEGCAPDVPMLLDVLDKAVECFFDFNLSVVDPIREHNAFKRRLCWTTEEHQIFVDKWAVYPKNFRKIGDFLPDKTVKDVIEHYYVTKNMSVLMGSRRKLGKKVIAEGKVHHEEEIPS